MQYCACTPTATLFSLLSSMSIVIILSVFFRVIEGVANRVVIDCCDWQSRNERNIALDRLGV